MAKVIMVQGTMSGAGKSLVVAGLCRIFKQDGYRVAPFKSQNMALNSFITEEGLEMGRAQVMQAEAAGIKPKVCMNPILLKPTSDRGSQVIVNGQVLQNMDARAYFAYKKSLIPEIQKAFRKLSEEADIIVIEGAGSPAEINLKENDIVNMGMAAMVDAPVLLVGDIDRGGVFAQLLGTLMLLEDEEKQRIGGLIINKFRGDKTILDPGIAMLEEKGQLPVVGVLPYLPLNLEDEDSLSGRFDRKQSSLINLAVVKCPRMSNFTDFDCFEELPEVTVHYITTPEELEGKDMLFIPGSKNTIGDLLWMRESGMEAAIKKYAKLNPVFGVCGGYQMMGKSIDDPEGTEQGGFVRGMELLPITTILRQKKKTGQTRGKFSKVDGIFKELTGMDYVGYEIHMGRSALEGETLLTTVPAMAEGDRTSEPEVGVDGQQVGNIYGSYVHGLFDEGKIAQTMVKALAAKRGISYDPTGMKTYRQRKEEQFDLLADAMRQNMDMDAVYKMLREAKINEP
ncbi:MAG: cobyric acid synthase [Lachnospiraceae bacterium]|nr:cobyric acid synthase [Lachnospiraceae bacterium]